MTTIRPFHPAIPCPLTTSCAMLISANSDPWMPQPCNTCYKKFPSTSVQNIWAPDGDSITHPFSEQKLRQIRDVLLKNTSGAAIDRLTPEMRTQLESLGLVSVIHLTNSEGMEFARENGLTARTGRPPQLFNKFDVNSPQDREFNRTGSIFAYSDAEAIDESRKGTMHLGTKTIAVFVNPDEVYVADAFLVDEYAAMVSDEAHIRRHVLDQGNYSPYRSAWDELDEYEAAMERANKPLRKIAARYHETAVTLRKYLENGNPGFLLPEVIIPKDVRRIAFETDETIPDGVREKEAWEIDLNDRAGAVYRIPRSIAHSWRHTERVTDNAARIAEAACPEHKKAAIVAAILHDIGRIDDYGGPEHAIAGAGVAPQFYPDDLTDIERESITFAIYHHGDREAPDGGLPITANYPEIRERGLIEELIGALWDADRIDLLRLSFIKVSADYLSTEIGKKILADRKRKSMEQRK